MKRVLILVEGQTEERFIKDVLAPELYSLNLVLLPTLLVTKKVKDGPDFKGGVTTFGRMENDLHRLLNKRGGALVTTLIDYYGLPDDTPGWATRPSSASALERVEHIEQQVYSHFESPPDFIPFFALHEFEAWLFSCPITLPTTLTAERLQPKFVSIRTQFSSPEEINDSPENAPSKRILRLFPGYRKTLHGPIAAQRIGLARLRSECKHLDQWIDKLERFALA